MKQKNDIFMELDQFIILFPFQEDYKVQKQVHQFSHNKVQEEEFYKFNPEIK